MDVWVARYGVDRHPDTHHISMMLDGMDVVMDEKMVEMTWMLQGWEPPSAAATLSSPDLPASVVVCKRCNHKIYMAK